MLSWSFVHLQREVNSYSWQENSYNLVAAKMSSNFFFRFFESLSGQLESSCSREYFFRICRRYKNETWWQKMTFSKTAFDTPISKGTCLSISAHLWLIAFSWALWSVARAYITLLCTSPWASTVLITLSSNLYSRLFFVFCVSWNILLTTNTFSSAVTTASFTLPLTTETPRIWCNDT